VGTSTETGELVETREFLSERELTISIGVKKRLSPLIVLK